MTTATDPRPSPTLPLPLTGLIGRERETAELRALLAPGGDGPRLVTLTGVGGAGKTRLALAVAHALADAYPDGGRFVDLAPLADPALVPQAVAVALGLREHPTRPVRDHILEQLRPRTALLILDNCEHLVDACAQLAEALLAACPGVRLLATSREALRVSGEAVWPVPPLAAPDPAQPPPLDTLAGYPAVRLFVARARAQQPGFTLTEGNAPAVAALCRRLDGIPLAIELAAARVPALPVEQLAARVGNALRLLTAGGRTAPSRQQTLRAALDWSHALLPPPEQQLFRRLAVFAGGWTLAAAEAACPGDGLEPDDVFELLAQLVTKSLVTAQEQGWQARYRLLEPVRQYAQEQLQAAGEEAQLRERHARFFLALVEEWEPVPWRDDHAAALARLEADHDNLRAALRWALEAGEAAMALRLAGALWRYWSVRGHLQEGQAWLAAALATGRGEAPTLRAKVLNGAGALAHNSGDLRAAVAFFEESLALWREAGEQQRMAGVLLNLGHTVADRGDFARAEALLRESLALYRALEYAWGEAITLHTLGWLRLRRGTPAEAVAPLEEAVAVFRKLRNHWGLSRALTALGDAALELGAADRARALQAESLALAWGQGDRLTALLSLEGLARAAGTWDGAAAAARAARLYAAAETLREALGAPLPPPERAKHERYVAAVRARLDVDAFAAAWAAGRALSLDEAIALAQQSPTLPEAGAPSRPAGEGDGDAPAGLTPREVDVLRLIAAGLSNQEVADALHLSVRTVERHIANLYGKLGARHRGDAVAAAFRLGLAPPEAPAPR